MSLIYIKDLSFQYEQSADMIFQHLTFHFDTEWKTALVGRNARGKTTLLKIILGEYTYQGFIVKKEECIYFPYQVKDMSLWVIDICQEIAPEIELWRLKKEFYCLGMKDDIFYRSFHTLSQGEQTKVLLAVLFLKDHTFLLIDEPTNHLDQKTRQLVAQYLSRQKGFLLVSHDRQFIDMCCDHVIAFNPQSIDVVKGNFSSWYENKENQDQYEIQKNIKLQKEIQRLNKSRQQKTNWSNQIEKTKNGHKVSGLKVDKGHVGHMSAKMMKRAKTIEKHQIKAIEENKKLLKNIEEYDDLKMHPWVYHHCLIEFRHCSLGYDNHWLFHDLSFSIECQERVLLKGANGCGKSSIIRYILDKSISIAGEYDQGSQLKISYVPQDCSYLSGSLDDLLGEYHVDMTLVKTILIKLGFIRSDFEKLLQYLSEGQKKKVLLAISLATSAHLYIWDEPLNYLDIFSRIQLEKLLLRYQPTLLFVEHDVYFQDNIATKIIDLDEVI